MATSLALPNSTPSTSIAQIHPGLCLLFTGWDGIRSTWSPRLTRCPSGPFFPTEEEPLDDSLRQGWEDKEPDPRRYVGSDRGDLVRGGDVVLGTLGAEAKLARVAMYRKRSGNEVGSWDSDVW